MADYTDIGFNQFLQKQDTYATGGGTAQTDPLQQDYLMQQMSASKITGGIMSSANGRFQLDLNQGNLTINNGTQPIIIIGVLPDGTIGLQIQDNNGNVLAKFNGNDSYVQSATARFITDYAAEQFLVKDQNDLPIALLGKQVGGF